MSDEEKKDNPIYMRLADGTLVDTATGKRVVSTEINKAFSDAPNTSSLSQAKRSQEFTGARRYLDDLPLPADQSRAVAAVAAYTLFGLSSADTAFALKTDVETVERVLNTEAFDRFLDVMLANIREHDKDKIRKKINAEAENAAKRLTELVSSKDEKVSLKAAESVLDRVAGDGLSSNDRNGSGNSLTIRIIDDSDNPHTKVKVEI